MTGAEAAGWRSAPLGERREVELGPGAVRHWVRGKGASLVFAHGILVNTNLWRARA